MKNKKKSRFYKQIVNGLISFDTNMSSLGGMSLSQNFNFYKAEREKQRFHYVVRIKNNIEVPTSDYDIRVGHFFKKEKVWFYCRKITKNISLTMKYDSCKKVFIINKLYYLYSKFYSIIPIMFGSATPAGKVLMDIITLDLFLDNIFFIGGIALKKNGAVTCLISPSSNGKTTNLIKLLLNDYLYISEDILIIDSNKKIIYPIAPNSNNFGKDTNKDLKKIPQDVIIKDPQLINRLVIAYNTMSHDFKDRKNISSENYLLTNSLNFLDNPFIKAFSFGNGIVNKVLANIDKIVSLLNGCENFIVKNYDFDSIFNKKNDYEEN